MMNGILPADDVRVLGVWGLAPIIKSTPSAHRLLKKEAQFAVARAKNPPRHVGGRGFGG